MVSHYRRKAHRKSSGSSRKPLIQYVCYVYMLAGMFFLLISNLCESNQPILYTYIHSIPNPNLKFFRHHYLNTLACFVSDSSKNYENGETVFTASLEGMKNVKSEQGEMLTRPFLDVCKLLLPILDKFGAAMTVVKSDISSNISRLEHKYDSNPTRFNYLFSFVQAEVETGTTKSSSSCTNGILWLTRYESYGFLVELFRNLSQHQDWGLQQSCTDSYSKTLKKWHGWLASSSFTVAIKLAPDRKKFMEVLGGAENIQSDMEKFCTNFSPLLREIHKFLGSFGLDSMKAL